MSTPHAQGTVLGFDFGEKRVGVAVADLGVGLAHPLQTLHAEDNKTRFAAIGALIAEWKPVQLVVGEPRHPDGGAHEIGRLARRFAQRLEGRFGLPVDLIDETLSSHAAQERLQSLSVRAYQGGKLKASLDAAAAAEILSTWLSLQQQQKKSPDTP